MRDFITLATFVKETATQKAGLMETATGYGSKLTSRYMVECSDKKTRRIYYRCFSNVASYYFIVGGDKVIIHDHQLDDMLSGVCFEIYIDQDGNGSLIDYKSHHEMITGQVCNRWKGDQ